MKRHMATSKASPVSPMFEAAKALVKVRALRRRFPLFVEWNLTFRCNLRCRYCGAFEARGSELGTSEVHAGLDALWNAGTRWITFGGGEPLLRADIREILRYARERGFQTFLNTNGWMLAEKVDVFDWLDHVNLSLDGPKDVHDAIRGAGAFDKTIEAVGLCREAGVEASFQCVLSSENLASIGDVLDLAARHGLQVMFQPASKTLDSSMKPNPLTPPVAPYRETIAALIEFKRRGAPVRNSVPGLKHLARWPDPTPVWCSAGILTASVEPDGTMVSCHQVQVGAFLAHAGADSAGPLDPPFHQLARPKNCRQCWCAPMVELSLLFSLNPGAIINALRLFR